MRDAASRPRVRNTFRGSSVEDGYTDAVACQARDTAGAMPQENPWKGEDMYARVATFKGEAGMEPAMADQIIEAIRGQAQANWDSPPEGLESAKEQLALVDREGGHGLGITLFETEEELRRGDKALNAMSPPTDPETTGRRTDVNFFEVIVRNQR